MNMHFQPIPSPGALEQNIMSRTGAPAAAQRRQPLDPFLGESAAIRSLADLAKNAALRDGPVVIEGERGTGKRSLAFWLHETGQRAAQPLIELNCGSFLRSGKQMESQVGLLEGQEQALAQCPGLAHGGTIVLAEIQRADLKLQARLLRMFGREASGMPANGKSSRSIRFITTAEQNLAELVQAKRLRADLYSRISGSTLRVPPLRERRGDLPVLAVQILANLVDNFGSRDLDLTRRALQVLQEYRWPGNIHELRIVLERAVLLASSALLTASDLHLGEPSGNAVGPEAQFRSLREVERQYIENVLQSVGGRARLAAKILDVPRSSLYHKLKQYRSKRTAMKFAS